MKGSATILIVEDSPTQAEYLSAILEDRGFQVVTTRNGEEALASMAKRRPDLVISDVTMPGIDGFELCSRIAHDPSLGKIPVILLTGLSHPADVFKGLESGASQFVTKPFEDDYLLSRVEYVLANAELRRQSGAELGIAVSFGGSRHFLTAERIQVIDLLLTSFAATVEKNIELEELNRELRAVRHELAQKNQELQALALHDELTGLHNRRGFNLSAELQIKVARRATGGALLFLDLDGFKHVNDTLGHDAGDELLLSDRRDPHQHLPRDGRHWPDRRRRVRGAVPVPAPRRGHGRSGTGSSRTSPAIGPRASSHRSCQSASVPQLSTPRTRSRWPIC